MVEAMKIIVTSFKRSPPCTAALSASDTEAAHRLLTPPLETPGRSRACLGQFLVVSLLLSPGSLCKQGFACALQKSVSPVLCKFWWLSVSQSVQSLNCVQLFVTPRIAARQASLSITNSRSSLRLTSIESVMPSSHLILCRPLLLLPSIPPSIRVFTNESTLHMRWPKYWSFSFSIIPSKELVALWWG